MEPSVPSAFNTPEPPIVPAPLSPNRYRRLFVVVAVVLLLLVGGAFAAISYFNPAAPKATPTPTPAPGVTTNEQSKLGDTNQPITLLQVTEVTASKAELGVVTATSINVGQDLTVTGNGSFGGNVTAANFNGSGANLTNVDAATLNGQPGAYYRSLANLTGTLSDSQLSSNVALRNAANTFSAGNTFNAASTFSGLLTANGSVSVTGPAAFSGGVTIDSLGLGAALTVPNGGTGLTSVAQQGILYGQGSGALGVAVPGGAGLCLMSGATDPVWGVCGGGGAGVASVNNQTGVVTIANASGAGGTVTIDNATTAAKGIASFNGTNFSVVAGAVNTVQNINTAASPTFAGLTLSSPLTVANGGTGASSLTANGVIIGHGAAALTSVAAGSPGQCFVSTAGAPQFQACTGNGGVDSVDTLAGALTLANSSGVGTTITIDNATTAAKGIASFNSTNFSVASGAVNTIQNIATTASPTFAGVGTNTITPSGAFTLGAAGQAFTLQGSATSTITATGGGFTTTVGFTGSPTASVTYNFDRTATGGPYNICTTSGNCASAGGGVTTLGGTTNTIPKFTGAQTLGDSSITDAAGTVTIGATLAVNTITPTSTLTIGATGQNLTLQGAGSTKLTATTGGITNTLQFAAPAASGKTITIPNASGTVAVSATGPLSLDAAGNLTCASCVTSGGGGGGVGAVDSLNTLTGALTIANATTGGSTITINNAAADGATKGIATFNSTNFSAASGVVNTIQGISSAASPTFTGLTLSGNLTVQGGSATLRTTS
ncbi:MAG TPA: hypothetical protein VLF67_04175, partial [Candidatus Saccharimonas sp.]|nr:hypothetical protein [Candidatus Saccharimonas sp.]